MHLAITLANVGLFGLFVGILLLLLLGGFSNTQLRHKRCYARLNEQWLVLRSDALPLALVMRLRISEFTERPTNVV
jgi:hypothetical protein